MAESRRCGWLGEDARGDQRPVWARKRVVATTCPVSYITANSQAWIEEFTAWKTIRGVELYSLPARTVEAFCVLEAELAKEMRDGNG
jgi:hypothetical protein